jgi:hypothetical protein
MPDSIRPVREPTERSYTLWVCDGCEAVGLVSEPCESCWDPLTRVEVVPVAEVERLEAALRRIYKMPCAYPDDELEDVRLLAQFHEAQEIAGEALRA